MATDLQAPWCKKEGGRRLNMPTVGAVMPNSSDDSAHADAAQRTFEHAFELWISEEIERGRAAGALSEPFELKSAQVVMEVDGIVSVRLNGEVKSAVFAQVNRPVQKGELLTASDIGEFNFHLTEDDPNAGHFTVMNIGGAWCMSFDFRYNRGRIQQHLEAATEFASCGAHAIKSGFTRAAIDNLFSAAELVARAILLALPDEKLLDPGLSHGDVEQDLNRFGGHFWHVGSDFMTTYNRL